MANKPIINIRSSYNNHEMLAHMFKKVRIAFRDRNGRKRIKLCKIKVKFNCECCGCMVEAVDKDGVQVATACGGYQPGAYRI